MSATHLKSSRPFQLTVFVIHIVANEARNLAVGDEDGTIHIVDTKKDDSHPGMLSELIDCIQE